MKHIIFLFLVALTTATMQAGMSNSIEYGQLFIVGDATDTGWNLGSAAEMPKIAKGVFEWTGRLTGGREFKFMNTREAWHKHIVSAKKDVVAEVGKEYPLNFFANWGLDGSLDCKFKVAESGTYTITVDLTSMRMAFAKQAENLQWPQEFYLVGTATDNQGIEIPDYYGVEHKKTLTLHSGFVKLTDTPSVTEQSNYYVPLFPEVDISYGKDYTMYLYKQKNSDDKGWSVSVPGEYTIYLDKARHTMLCTPYRRYKTLYLVGGCCERTWNYWDDSNNRFYEDPDNADIMVWEGELRIGWDKKTDNAGNIIEPEEPNKFKILTEKSWFKDTFHPYKADTPAEGCSDARISGGDDFKWTITRDGYYRLELNTRTETLTCTLIEPKTSTEQAWHEDASSVTNVDVCSETEETTYYNLEGVKVGNDYTGATIERHPSGTTKTIHR